MKKSRFQFSNPHMTRAVFHINEGFSGGDEIEIPTQITVHRKWNDDESSALIELEVEVGGDDANLPFFVSMVYSATFRWEEDALQEDMLEKLLSLNAPSLLLGYVRPAIAAITNLSKYPSYNIPFLDFARKDDSP